MRFGGRRGSSDRLDNRRPISQAAAMLSVVLAWEKFKDWLSATVHLSHWSLHVILGLAFFILFGRLFRRPPTSFLPLLPVAVLEFGNELLDYLRDYIPHWRWNGHDTAIEVALTLGPALALVLVARAWPARRRFLRAAPFARGAQERARPPDRPEPSRTRAGPAPTESPRSRPDDPDGLARGGTDGL